MDPNQQQFYAPQEGQPQQFAQQPVVQPYTPPTTGRVEVFIVQAYDLPKKQDPYVDVVTDLNTKKVVKKTKTIKSTNNPVWRERCEVTLNPSTDKITFYMWDWEAIGKHKPLGEFSLRVDVLPFKTPVELHLPLECCPKGVLQIEVTALDYGVNPQVYLPPANLTKQAVHQAISSPSTPTTTTTTTTTSHGSNAGAVASNIVNSTVNSAVRSATYSTQSNVNRTISNTIDGVFRMFK